MIRQADAGSSSSDVQEYRQFTAAQEISVMNRKRKIILGSIAGVLIVAVAGTIVWANTSGKNKVINIFNRGGAQTESEISTAKVTKADLTSEISSSGTIAAKNTYNITSLVAGEIIEAGFEEGDSVKEGQVLYRIDASSMESELKSAGNSLERSEISYEDATKDYEKALEEYSDDTYKSKRAGYITKLYIEPGDKVGANTQIGDLYNEQQMKIKVPFLSGEAVHIGGGAGAVLTLTDMQEQIGASVYSVSNMDEVLESGAIVRYVTLAVSNPGGLTKEMTATAQIGDFTSAGTGTFEAWTDTKLNCDISGNVEVEKLMVHEGDYVSVGTPLFKMTEDSARKLNRTYKDAVDNAEEKMESAQQKVDSSSELYDEYTITSPVDGIVITKTYKVGDKIGSSGNQGGSTTLAVVYDMSQYTFEMSVDELDVRNVKAGQDVRVEADAFEGEEFYGKVTNVSLVSTAQNGVSTYPVTVTMNETYELLPGMNVDGYIVLGEAKEALVIPADSLMRGNKVYVRDESVTEQIGVVPAGFRAVEVETGLTNEDYVQIISGLNEGDEVYVPETSDSAGFGMFGGMQGGAMPGGGMPGAGMSGGQPGGANRSGDGNRSGENRAGNNARGGR